MPRRINPAGVYPLSPPKSFIFRQTSCLIKRNHYICCQNHVRYIYRLELTAMRNIILFIFIILTVHLNMSARGSGEKPSIVVLHSINFEESWTKQTYLDIENKREGRVYRKGDSLTDPRYPHDGRFSREETNDPRESTCATHLSRMHRRSLLAYHPPVV